MHGFDSRAKQKYFFLQKQRKTFFGNLNFFSELLYTAAHLDFQQEESVLRAQRAAEFFNSVRNTEIVFQQFLQFLTFFFGFLMFLVQKKKFLKLQGEFFGERCPLYN